MPAYHELDEESLDEDSLCYVFFRFILIFLERASAVFQDTVIYCQLFQPSSVGSSGFPGRGIAEIRKRALTISK